jgi:molecular chaperone GrpE
MADKNPSTGSGTDPHKSSGTDPHKGSGTDPQKPDVAAAQATSEDGDTADVESAEDLIQAEDADVETLTQEEISFLEAGERDLLEDMRNDLARAQAELVNFRKRVERDRAANRDAVIAEVVRTMLPAVDDLDRAEAHGDLAGSPLELIAQKLHAAFARYGLRSVGEKGEAFDPNFHEAVVQLPTAGVTVNTVADVIEPGYALGDRLLRAAKVAVSVPEDQ